MGLKSSASSRPLGPKHAFIVNSVEPDQTAPLRSGSTLLKTIKK